MNFFLKKWSRATGTTSAAAAAVEESVSEARPPGFAEYSSTTEFEFAEYSEEVKLVLVGSEQDARPAQPLSGSRKVSG